MTCITRRTFAFTNGLGYLAGSASRILRANDTIRFGLIGAGGRGRFLMRHTQAIPNTQFVAVADLYDGAREQGRRAAGPAAKAYKDHRELLDRKDIDAVFIATQNHWHVPAAMDALAAGKDVYIEKPLTHNLDEGPPLVVAARKSGRITQVGTQRRSCPLHLRARDLVAAGEIGKVTLVRVDWFRNSAEPGYRFAIPPDASPETIDWATYLKPARKRPFDAKRFFDWYCYWDYCEGIAEDLLVHELDAAQMILGLDAPARVVCDGGIFYWKDGREVPDTLTAVFDYAEDVQIQFSSTFANGREGNRAVFYGKKGTLEIRGMDTLSVYPEDDSPAPEPALTFTREQAGVKDAVAPHLANFVECLRSRKPANCPVEIGEKGAVCSHLATLSLRERRFVQWDAAQHRLA